MVNEELLKLVTQRVMEKIQNYHSFRIPVGVSNRHFHVSQEDLEILSGKAMNLQRKAT